MIEMGKHLFIFAYIFAFITGLVNITLMQLLLSQTQNRRYGALRFFYFAFLIHIAINFVYFYRAYFVSFWEWKILILTAVNLSTVLFVYLGIFALEKISENGQEKNCWYESQKKPVLMGTGVIYIMTFSVVRSHHINAEVTFDDLLSGSLFVGTNLAFTIAAIYCCLKEFKKAKVAIENKYEKKILYGISSTILFYVSFNFLIDVYFGNITDKLLILNVNAYHLVVFAYIGMQIVLIYSSMSQLKVNSNIAQSPPGMRPEDCIEKIGKERGLTYREKELIILVYNGCSNQEIGEKLYISENTVKRHMTNIYRKMGIGGRVGLIRMIGKNE